MHDDRGCFNTDLESELKQKLVLKHRLIEVTEDLDSSQIHTVLSFARGLNENNNSQVIESPSVLSDRESEVLLLIANGYTRREIGCSLGISMNTAARHIANIYRKLDISSVAEATIYAYRNAMI